MSIYKICAKKLLEIPYKDRDTCEKIDNILNKLYISSAIGIDKVTFINRVRFEIMLGDKE